MELKFDDSADALFDSNYLRWFHLQGEPALIKITGVEKNVEMTLPGGKQEKKPVLSYVLSQGKIEDAKPLVLNHTNASEFARTLGNKPSKWKGQEIVLYPTTTQIYSKETKKMETKGCIRVRAKK